MPEKPTCAHCKHSHHSPFIVIPKVHRTVPKVFNAAQSLELGVYRGFNLISAQTQGFFQLVLILILTIYRNKIVHEDDHDLYYRHRKMAVYCALGLRV